MLNKPLQNNFSGKTGSKVGDAFVTQPENTGIGEQLLSTAAEMGLLTQLEDADLINIDIQGDFLHLVQGEANSITLEGRGLVTPQDIRLEKLELRTDSVAIDPLGAILGEIKLNHPTDAWLRVVVTTGDLNRALNSEYLRRNIRNVKIPLKNHVLTLDLQQGECLLPGDGRLVLKAEVLTHLSGEIQPAVFQTTFKIGAGGQYIAVEQGEYLGGKELPLEVTTAVLNKVSQLLERRDFQYKEIALHLKQIEVETGKITLLLRAYIKQIPS